MNRRNLIKSLLTGFGFSLFGCGTGGGNNEEPSTEKTEQIFPQSIASGDPTPYGIILWTRINPEFVNEKEVKYQISTDKEFKDIVVEGFEEINTDGNSIVKVFIENELEPWRTYYYRFIYRGTKSKTGKFKTLPEQEQDIQNISFVYMSCQDYVNGYFTSYPHVVNEDIDFVVWLGDYIYETAEYSSTSVREINLPSGKDKAQGLEDYYYLYNTYKSDKNLQLLHENFAFIPVWDDHEYANDCYGYHAPDHNFKNDENKLKKLRLEATKAWYENLPVNVPYNPDGQDIYNIQIYRSFRYGKLMELILTDERLYRSSHPCGEDQFTERYLVEGCGEEKDSDRTMLGKNQRNWFLNKVESSNSEWVFWGNPVMMMKFKIDKYYLTFDDWDGYQYERKLILQKIKSLKDENKLKNFVVLTGDLHSFVVGKLSSDFKSDAIAEEFVVGSVSSSNLSEILSDVYNNPILDFEDAAKLFNKHIEYINSHDHGYALVKVNKFYTKITFKKVETIKEDTSDIKELKSFIVYNGNP